MDVGRHPFKDYEVRNMKIIFIFEDSFKDNELRNKNETQTFRWM